MTKWHFSTRTSESWQSLKKDIEGANTSIEIEQYILADDEVGRPFLELLCKKAKQRVQVTLMLDKVGSRSVYYSKWPRKLAKCGGDIRFFNPVTWQSLFFPRRWFPRSHVKLMLVDDKIAHLGSACIEQSMKAWRDTHIRLEGAITESISKGFKLLWKSPYKAKYISPHGKLRYVAGKPSRNFFYKELLNAIDRAKHTIEIAGPYIMPSLRFKRYLRRAAARGVEVRMLVTGPTDVLLANCVAHSYFRSLLKAGIQIFVYKPTVLHTKYAIIDGEWATFGSMNFDHLSFFHNREANLIVTDEAMLKELIAHNEADHKQSSPYTMKDWKRRPWPYKLLGYLGRPLKRIL